jgi:hypothetical protein
MEVSGELDDPAALPPGKEAVWMLWSRDKILASAGNRTQTVQPQIRRYTDWTLQAHEIMLIRGRNRTFFLQLTRSTLHPLLSIETKDTDYFMRQCANKRTSWFRDNDLDLYSEGAPFEPRPDRRLF